MPNPASSAHFTDVLDRRFSEIATGVFDEVKDWVPELYNMGPSEQLTDRWSELTPVGLHSQFTGLVGYEGPSQGYNVTATALEWAKGMQIERLLSEYDLFGLVDDFGDLLGRSAAQTRQVHAWRPFNNAFSNDTAFYNRSEGVAICSDSHTTVVENVSTSTGFDNLTTAALSPTSLKSAYILFRKIRDAAGQRMDNHVADTLIVPVDLRDTANEILGTDRGVSVDFGDSTKNVLQQRYNVVDSIWLDSTSNWFIADKAGWVRDARWQDKVKKEFAGEENFDALTIKLRSYMLYQIAILGWRNILGANVS